MRGDAALRCLRIAAILLALLTLGGAGAFLLRAPLAARWLAARTGGRASVGAIEGPWAGGGGGAVRGFALEVPVAGVDPVRIAWRSLEMRAPRPGPERVADVLLDGLAITAPSREALLAAMAALGDAERAGSRGDLGALPGAVLGALGGPWEGASLEVRDARVRVGGEVDAALDGRFAISPSRTAPVDGARLDVALAPRAATSAADVTSDASWELSIDDLRVRHAADERDPPGAVAGPPPSILALPRLRIAGVRASPALVRIDEVRLERPAITARREVDGTLVVAGLRLPPPTAVPVAVPSGTAAPVPPPAALANGPALSLGRLRVTDGAVLLWDGAMAPALPGEAIAPSLSPWRAEASAISLTASGVRVGAAAVPIGRRPPPGALTATFRMRGGGESVAASEGRGESSGDGWSGAGRLQAVLRDLGSRADVDLVLRLTDVDLASLSGALVRAARTGIASGHASARIDVTLRPDRLRALASLRAEGLRLGGPGHVDRRLPGTPLTVAGALERLRDPRGAMALGVPVEALRAPDGRFQVDVADLALQAFLGALARPE